MAFIIQNSQESVSLQRKKALIHQGQLFKQGKFNRAWRARWFCLYNTRKLAYYNDRQESIAMKAIAEIDLSKVDHIVNDRSKDVQNKYVFELITGGRTFYLACSDMQSLNIWEKRLYEMVLGTVIHVGYLRKKGDRIQSWRQRWFRLSNLRELRYYEDESEKKAKGSIDLSNVSIVRHGDKDQYGQEYSFEIITPDRTWVLVAFYDQHRVEWMEQLNVSLGNGIKMNVLYQGWLWKFEQHGISANSTMADWTKKFYGIDRETLNLYYVQSHNKFKQFSSTLFFDKSYYLNAVDTQLQGALPISHAVVAQYGNDDPQFDNSSQKSNPYIFRIKNVLGEHYFAADNEQIMKEWLHHLNWAIGSGPDKVVNKVTKGGNQQQNQKQHKFKKGQFLDDDYLEKQQPQQPKQKIDKPQIDKKSIAIVKMQRPKNADLILKRAENKGKEPEVSHDQVANNAAPMMMPMFRFGPDGMPIMDDDPPQPMPQMAQPPQNSQKQNVQKQNENKAEIELIQKWRNLILPYANNINKLEAEAQFPCHFGDDQFGAKQMHEKCGCVERISVLMDYYMSWMSIKQQKSNVKAMGMSFLISILSDYSMSALLNDFFHLKRFHAEDIYDNYAIEALTTYFAKNFGGCPIEECVCLSRNNRNFIKCQDFKILRAWYYIDQNEDAEIIGTSMEYEEIATQQILDLIHCFIYHGSEFSFYDTMTQQELAQIRKVYSMRKQKFGSNRYLTSVHPYHHIPYRPMAMETPKGFMDTPHTNGFDDAKYNDVAQMYEYTPNSFGIDMEHNIYSKAAKKYGRSKYYDFKQEMMSHPRCKLSPTQWNTFCLKASILLSTFQGKLLKSRQINSDFMELDPMIYDRNGGPMTQQMCTSLLIYCQCEELRVELMSTYFKIFHINETVIDCRKRHYAQFYHWGKLLYTAIIAFGTEIYSDSNASQNFMANKNTQQSFYYHNVTKPVLFNNFNAKFYGPTSFTNSKNVSLIHMPTQERDGIVLELDTNNVGWTTPYALNVSIFSNNPSEREHLFDGGASLGIHNIVSVYHHKALSNLSNYTSAITLLRFIIGDTGDNNMDDKYSAKISHYDDKYTEQVLDEFDENICKHLGIMIDHQVSIYKNNKNINEYRNFSSDVPLYIALVLNSWCLNKSGIIQLNMNLLNKLPKPLMHKFVYESPDNVHDYSINWPCVFNLFPNCPKIWKRGLYFNNYLCEQWVQFLCSGYIERQHRYKMNGIVFSCTIDSDWRHWVQIAKKHSSIIKQMDWLITASPPKKNQHGNIEKGRVSFIKRINNKHK